MIQVDTLCSSKFALLDLSSKASSPQSSEYFSKVDEVFLKRVAVDHQVVNVRTGRLDVTDNVVHQPLKGCGGPFQAKRHDIELKESKGGCKGCLRSVLGCNGNLPISSCMCSASMDLKGMASGYRVIQLTHTSSPIDSLAKGQ